jgi:syntaxin 16
LTELRGLEGAAAPFDRAPTPQNPYMDPSLMESDADKSFSQSTLMQTSQRLTGQHDEAIEQREREINDIAKSIIELSDIFRELQAMVIDQGTMLDRIDYNIERMGTEVKAAEKELKVVCSLLMRRSRGYQWTDKRCLKATNYQRRTTKRKILLLLIILVAGMIILLIVKPKRHSSPAPTPSPPPPVEQPPAEQPPSLFPRTSTSVYRRKRRPFPIQTSEDKLFEPGING